MLKTDTLYFVFDHEVTQKVFHLSDPLPLLRRFFKYCEKKSTPYASICEWSLGQFEIYSETQMGIAAILSANENDSPDDYWLCITPVSLQPTSNDLYINPDSKITEEESKELFSLISNHLTEYSITYVSKDIWVLKSSDPIQLCTKPFNAVAGLFVSDNLISGIDAKSWKLRIAEIEILFHQHPINETRRSEQAAEINSVWIWGAGKLPKTKKIDIAVSSERKIFLNLTARSFDARISLDIENLSELILPERIKEVIIDIQPQMIVTNSLEDFWLKEAFKVLDDGKVKRLVCVFESKGNVLEFSMSKISKFKFWKGFGNDGKPDFI